MAKKEMNYKKAYKKLFQVTNQINARIDGFILAASNERETLRNNNKNLARSHANVYAENKKVVRDNLLLRQQTIDLEAENTKLKCILPTCDRIVEELEAENKKVGDENAKLHKRVNELENINFANGARLQNLEKQLANKEDEFNLLNLSNFALQSRIKKLTNNNKKR